MNKKSWKLYLPPRQVRVHGPCRGPCAPTLGACSSLPSFLSSFHLASGFDSTRRLHLSFLMATTQLPTIRFSLYSLLFVSSLSLLVLSGVLLNYLIVETKGGYNRPVPAVA